VEAQPAIPAASEPQAESPALLSVAEKAKREAATAPLSDYFKDGYLDGKLYEGPYYDRHHDEELGILLLKHRRSGILVWREAIDLRVSSTNNDSQVLFHYTSRDALKDALGRDRDPSMLIKLLNEHLCGDFGPGLLANTSEPEVFGYKDDVIVNNHWPRIADPMISDREHETWLLVAGDSTAGPGDSRNFRVVDAILENPQNHGRADFCIPLIVSQCFVYDIWKHSLTQASDPVVVAVEAERERGEVAMVGHSRWGDKQWTGRDICMVDVSIEGKAVLAEAVCKRRLEIVNKRIKHLDGAKGRTHADTMAAVEDSAQLLHKLGRYDDAVESQLRVVYCRLAMFGESHSHTLTAQHCLGRCLKDASRLEEAEELFRRVVHSCKETLGPDHPTTVGCTFRLGSPGESGWET